MSGKESMLSERLRRELPGVSSPAMGGDNLAVTLVSYFEPYVESEELDATDTWKQRAIDQADEVLDAIHAHYADLIEAQAQLLAEAKEVVSNFAAYPVSSIGSDFDGYVIHLAVGGQQPTFADFDRARALLSKLEELK